MEVDSDITRVSQAIEAFNSADSVLVKQQKLNDLERVVGVVFATSEVRDRLHQFLVENLANDDTYESSKEEEGETKVMKSKYHLSIINFIRKLQSKNFINRRLQLSDWYILLNNCVLASMELTASEEHWSASIQLLMSTEKTLRVGILPPMVENGKMLVERFGDLLAHPLNAERHAMLQRSEGVCRHLLNFLINTVNTLHVMEEDLDAQIKEEAKEEGDEETSVVVEGERKVRRQSVLRLSLMVVSALTSHESELGRWSLLQTLEQIESRLIRYSAGIHLPNSLITECNIEKIGKNLQCLLRNWPIPTIRLWRVLIRVLDKCVLTSVCFNALAPVIADSLHRLANSPKVQLLTQDAWRDLVDIFTFYPGSRESFSRMCLLLRVYRRVYVQEVVQVRRLLGWWHFITRLSLNMLHQLYETALTPFLSHILGYFPVDPSVSQEEAEKQFGYRLSAPNGSSHNDCLYLASHVMAELWLQVDTPDEKGEEMRAKVLEAILEGRKSTPPSTDDDEKVDLALQQIYHEKLETFPHKNLPVELFAKKPIVAERMLRYLQRWLQLWRYQADVSKSDPSNAVLIWILSRSLRKWLLLVDQTAELPSSEKLVVQLVALMVKTISDACVNFDVDLASRVDCVMAILTRPNLSGCLIPRQANFREWPAFILFVSIVDFHDIQGNNIELSNGGDGISVSETWGTAIQQLLYLLGESPLQSIELFTLLAEKLLQVSRRVSLSETRIVLDLLKAWQSLAQKLTLHIQRTHEVASGDLALKPCLGAVETCLCFPFDLASRIKCQVPSDVGPSDTEIASTLTSLYEAMFEEAVLLGPVLPNSWCNVMAHSIDNMVETEKSNGRFILPSVALCVAMLGKASLSLDLNETSNERENVPTSPSAVEIVDDDDEGKSLSELKRKWLKKKGISLNNAQDSPTNESRNEHRNIASFSPGQWIRGRQLPVGNLTSTFETLMNVLKDLPEQSDGSQADDDASPAVKPTFRTDEVNQMMSAVSSCLRQLLLEKIQRPGSLLALLEDFGDAIVNIVDWCERLPPRTLKPSVRQRIESIPIDLLDHVKAVYRGPYDSKLLTHLTPIICGICAVQSAARSAALTPSQRKAKRALIVPFSSFWNSTFAECHHLEYSEELLSCLKNAKNRYRLPIYLPPNSGTLTAPAVAVPEEDTNRVLPQRQDSQLNSVFSSTPIVSPPKPVPLVGSFLHRTSPMLPKAASPMEVDKSPGTEGGPTLDGKPTVLSRVVRSPALNFPPPKTSFVEDDNSEDFVFVPTASVRLTRLRLTEHQKERMTELRRSEYLPAMYNGLDNSQPSQPPYLRSGSLDSGSQMSQRSQQDSSQPVEVQEVASSPPLLPLAERLLLNSKSKPVSEETAENAPKKTDVAEEAEKEGAVPNGESASKDDEDDADKTAMKEKPNAESDNSQTKSDDDKIVKVVGRPFLVEDEGGDSGASSTRLVLEDAETKKGESESSKVSCGPPFLVEDGFPGEKVDGASNISTIAVVSSPMISSPGGASDAADAEKENEEVPADPPAGCSTPLSGEKKPRGPLRLGVSGLAARIQSKVHSSAPSKLSLSLPETESGRGTGAKQRPLSLVRSSGSRGAKMVALAQASQAERREKARQERESCGGSIASDSSFNSQRSLTSPPGIIRSFFTPSKGHRVSFAEPLTSTWDGASPRAASVSLCVEIGTPRDEVDAESCRKSLVDEFETANTSWDEPPANDLNTSTGDALQEDKEQDDDVQNVTVAMVGGEAVDIEKFHSSESQDSEIPSRIKQDADVEVIEIGDDDSPATSAADGGSVEDDSDDVIEVRGTQEGEEKSREDEEETSASPPCKRRRVQIEIEASDEDIEVKDSQNVPQSITEGQKEALDADEGEKKEPPSDTEAPKSNTEEEEETQPIQISLHTFVDSQTEDASERPTAVTMYLDAPADSETQPGAVFDEVCEELGQIERKLKLLTSDERMKIAGEMAKLLQLCLNGNQ